MTTKRARDTLRLVHLAAAVLIGFLVYSPLATSPGFVLALRLVVFPVLALAGLGMWQLPRVRGLARGRRAPAAR